MKPQKKIFISSIIFIMLLSCSTESVEIIENTSIPYKEILNVSYGTDSKQVYDIYLPKDRNSNTKVMILVHGGGWISGDKSDMEILKDLYKQDFPNLAIVSINYRLADQNNPPFPMQINDITAVINHLKKNKENNVISDEFGFLGTSAGGHLALLWSYAFDTQKNIKMVAGIVSPTNFTDDAYINATNPELKLLLSIYGVNTSPEFLKEISPLHRANASSPPTILFNGGQDPLVPVTQGTGLRDQLNSLGVINEFTLYPNAGHGWTEGVELLHTWNKLKTFTILFMAP
ncbi:alpha/beta hydrolase fold domain-containing protein [Mariniflexile sp. HNIBRBA6329]|uniref:alpha/beta hydrolase fold domain-containing protein n=1 Tax=Mariniflexile sp. HNIBRBA6329 TaxID=3373088 RepID=UPI003744B3AE